MGQSAAAIVYECDYLYLRVCLSDGMEICVPPETGTTRDKTLKMGNRRRLGMANQEYWIGFEYFPHFGFFGVDLKTEIGVTAVYDPSGTNAKQFSVFHCGNLHWRFFFFVLNRSPQSAIIQISQFSESPCPTAK
jgi:hypothetical protein